MRASPIRCAASYLGTAIFCARSTSTACSVSDPAMTNIAKLDTAAHRDLRIKGGPSATLGDAQRFAAVIPGEFTQLATVCPLFFSKDAETGSFYAGAMLGFDEGENLFLSEDGYQGHRPLSLQRMPFFT